MDENTRSNGGVDASAGIVWQGPFANPPGPATYELSNVYADLRGVPRKPDWFYTEGHRRDPDGTCPCGAVEGSEHIRPAPAPRSASPKVGDRVKVTIEGEVVSTSSYGFEVGRMWIDPSLPAVSVDVLDAEWEPGDVAVCPHGRTYLRTLGGYWITLAGEKTTDPCPIDRPLALLARGGKAV